jgi:hypothetical protein
MSVLKKAGIVIVTGIVGLGVLHLGERLSISSGVTSFVSTAQARVGRPLSPVSVAGVARRTGRRCANGTYNC